MLKLDRDRPFGIVYPGSPKAAYEQDGVLFDADGNAPGSTRAKTVAQAPVAAAAASAANRLAALEAAAIGPEPEPVAARLPETVPAKPADGARVT